MKIQDEEPWREMGYNLTGGEFIKWQELSGESNNFVKLIVFENNSLAEKRRDI